MKNKITTIIITILLLFNLSLLYKISNIGKTKNQAIDNKTEVQSSKNYDFGNQETLEKMMFNQIESEGYKINKNVKLMKLASKDSVKLSSITQDKPKLIFYLDKNICTSCVENELDYLSKKYTKGNKKVAIISIDGNERDLFILDKKYKLGGELYLLKSALGIPAEKITQPLYFVLQNDLVTNVFVPNKNIVNYSNQYFKIINSKFFN
ncbi:hypothetical protein [Flavobacterium daejeonense]|uniref:hypothetical protein n=1 Tax=Flavobacterium daejeonense TaxID=350893 RepID=UPI00047913F1|nr:hypothetical protein [Flavobacterium daejeonense]